LAASAVLAGCGSDKDGNGDVVIDASVTESSPITIEVGGLEAEFYYDASYAPGPVYLPILFYKVTPAGPDSAAFRADLEVRQDEKLVDAYSAGNGGAGGPDYWYKNEFLIDKVSGVYSVGSFRPHSLPNPADPSETGYLFSSTGKDFTFILRNIEVGGQSFEPKNVVQLPSTASQSPSFDMSTPDGRFNKSAAEQGWQAPNSFVSTSSDNEFYVSDPSQQPAASMRSFIKQVNEWGDSGYATTSPTQIFKQWMTDWNPEMLKAGIDALGDPEIKETYQRVKSGDIEVWFGNGTHVVGTGPNQIPPGTYQCTAPDRELISDGYWERTSAGGDIIENNFVTSAQEVTVTIGADDGQFTSNRIGTCRPVE